MLSLSEKQISEYLYRSYISVDGLWFMKVEEVYGFDTALEIDEEVWKVVPKIQARALKSLAGMGDGIDALFECLTAKLAIEGFYFDTEKNADSFRIIVSKCPWHDMRVKAGRETISGKVGDVICGSEYAVWASEFKDNIRFEQEAQACKGAHCCVLKFSR